MNHTLKYFIYIRKSTEGKDRQVLSHEGQLSEIEKIVERENLVIVDVFKESKSAHIPDNRPLFAEMLKRIKRGEANGIITWHTNRLSRNPKESGVVQQMLQDGAIKSIIVPYRHFRSEDNALLFSIETSEANQYSRDLKVAVKRGLKQKYEMGHPPSYAQIGYLNTKSALRGSNKIIVDPERWSIMRKGFDMLLTETHSVAQILDILNNKYGLRTRLGTLRGGRPLSRSGLYRIFTNPFYCGMFYRGGVLYKGAYKPMITVEEFDRIQIILGRKGKPRPKRHIFTYTGLMTCGMCGSAITAIEKQKRLKSGQVRTYIFYYCTKRKKGASDCPERKYMREEALENLIVDELRKYELQQLFMELGMGVALKNYQAGVEKYRSLVLAQDSYEKRVQQELGKLVDLCISGAISQELYLLKKAEKEELLIRIRSKKEQLETVSTNWIKGFEKDLNFTTNLVNRFLNGDREVKKELCRDFGLNWSMSEQKLLIEKPMWLEAIKNYKDGVEPHFDRFDPEKTVKEKGWNASLETVSPYLCALVDSVRLTKNKEGDIPGSEAT